MGFLIRRKSDGQEVADVSAVIAIEKMDDPYFWWKYGVLAYLHDRKLATHADERGLYTATSTADYETRHKFVDKALAERQERLEAERAQRRAAAQARREAKKAAKQKAKATVSSSHQPQYASPYCPNCGYHDPHFGKGVICPNCGDDD